MGDTHTSQLRDVEKLCAQNCVRKHERGYKLYSSIEDKIFESHMESTGMDPEQFYANVNAMSKEEMAARTVSQMQGLSTMQDSSQALAGAGQANEEKYFNLPPGVSKGQAA